MQQFPRRPRPGIPWGFSGRGFQQKSYGSPGEIPRGGSTSKYVRASPIRTFHPCNSYHVVHSAQTFYCFKYLPIFLILRKWQIMIPII